MSRRDPIEWGALILIGAGIILAYYLLILSFVR